MTFSEVVARATWAEPDVRVRRVPVHAHNEHGPVTRMDEERELAWRRAPIPEELRDRLQAARFPGTLTHIERGGICTHFRFASSATEWSALLAQRGARRLLREVLVQIGTDGCPGRWEIAERDELESCSFVAPAHDGGRTFYAAILGRLTTADAAADALEAP